MLNIFIWLMEFILGFLKKPSAGYKAIDAVIENKQEVINNLIKAKQIEEDFNTGDAHYKRMYEKYKRKHDN